MATLDTMGMVAMAATMVTRLKVLIGPSALTKVVFYTGVIDLDHVITGRVFAW